MPWKEYMPTAVIAGLLGVHWFAVRKQVKEHDETYQERFGQCRDEVAKKLDEKEHTILCKNAALETQLIIAHKMDDVQGEIKRLGDSVFEAIRDVEKQVKKLNGGS